MAVPVAVGAGAGDAGAPGTGSTVALVVAIVAGADGVPLAAASPGAVWLHADSASAAVAASRIERMTDTLLNGGLNSLVRLKPPIPPLGSVS